MTRRPGLPLYYSRYCGNINKMKVHDLDKENKSSHVSDCLGHLIGHNSRDRLGHLEEHTGLSLIENMITERINENERWSLEEMVKI